jgi:hypothetical protein
MISLLISNGISVVQSGDDAKPPLWLYDDPASERLVGTALIAYENSIRTDVQQRLGWPIS